VNIADLFFKARRELPPGTILYADITALFEFLSWTPEAARNAEDHDWDEPFPAVMPGVYILEAGCVSAGSSGPACLVQPWRFVSRTIVVPAFLVPRARKLRWELYRWWTALRALLLFLALNS
jgi:hypothetical protein